MPMATSSDMCTVHLERVDGELCMILFDCGIVSAVFSEENVQLSVATSNIAIKSRL